MISKNAANAASTVKFQEFLLDTMKKKDQNNHEKEELD